MDQNLRIKSLERFRNKSAKMLIASDVAARGLDIPSVSHVFNFDVPSNAEDYVHRIGRTGRAGRTGAAFTIAATEDDKKYLHAIETLIGKPIELDGSAGTAPAKAKTDAGTASDPDHKDTAAGKDKPAVKKGRSRSKKEAMNENSDGASDKLAPQKNSKYPNEKRPPEWKGNSFRDSDHIPAFLR